MYAVFAKCKHYKVGEIFHANIANVGPDIAYKNNIVLPLGSKG